MTTLKIVNPMDSPKYIFNNNLKIYLDDMELTTVQRIDFPVEHNDFMYVTIRFAPERIEWVNMDEVPYLDANKPKVGRFVKGAWVVT